MVRSRFTSVHKDSPPPADDPETASYSSYPAPRKGWDEGWRSVLLTIILVLLAPIIAFSLSAFVIQSYQVDGESMETTLQNHDRLLVDKVPRTIARISGHQYVPHRGDIIIFNQNNLPGYIGPKQLIKRVVALPGERVVVKDGVLTIYNQGHPNGFNPDTSDGYHLSSTLTIGQVDVTLQAGQVFVCGDNRSNSEDSRYFGPIQTSSIVGKLVLRFLPLNNFTVF